MNADMRDMRVLKKINAIAEPWNDNSIDREPWIVTLPSGREVSLHCPIGAAVQIAHAGHKIRAGLT